MNRMCYGLADKVALVTGGSRGIGLEIVRRLLAEDARVVICGRKQENLDAAVEHFGNDERLTAIQAHIGKEADVEAMFEVIRERRGHLDILINNVGMNLLTLSVTDTEPALWRKILETNLNGTFLCSRKAAAMMKERQRGKVVNITSIAGRKASPGMGIYGIAKAGVEMLTRVLASELAPFNIQVNAVSPGMVRTDFSRPFWSNEELHAQIVKNIPLGRIAEPADVVHPVLFLCSDAADYITGQTLVVDGGATVI